MCSKACNNESIYMYMYVNALLFISICISKIRQLNFLFCESVFMYFITVLLLLNSHCCEVTTFILGY